MAIMGCLRLGRLGSNLLHGSVREGSGRSSKHGQQGIGLVAFGYKSNGRKVLWWLSYAQQALQVMGGVKDRGFRG